ncbi:MAG: cyclase family protein, partial [bacterium]|nr:cyclase family protein [bacterium]
MAIVEQLGPYRVVDLSKPIHPDRETRRCEVIRYYQEWTKDYHSDMNLESHLGTHVETPYHYDDAWPDILGLPLTAFMGRAVLLELDIAPKAPVTDKELEAADRGRIKPGDVVILTSPYHCEPFSND